jgi:hypothetical protein
VAIGAGGGGFGGQQSAVPASPLDRGEARRLGIKNVEITSRVVPCAGRAVLLSVRQCGAGVVPAVILSMVAAIAMVASPLRVASLVWLFSTCWPGRETQVSVVTSAIVGGALAFGEGEEAASRAAGRSSVSPPPIDRAATAL